MGPSRFVGFRRRQERSATWPEGLTECGDRNTKDPRRNSSSPKIQPSCCSLGWEQSVDYSTRATRWYLEGLRRAVDPTDILQSSIELLWQIAAVASLAELPGTVQAPLCHEDMTPDGKYDMNLYSSMCQKQAVVIYEYNSCHGRLCWDKDVMTRRCPWICTAHNQKSLTEPTVRVLETLWIVMERCHGLRFQTTGRGWPRLDLRWTQFEEARQVKHASNVLECG